MNRAARLITTPGFICAECDDLTRVGRCCPKPLRNPNIARQPGQPACDVLTVPGWFWDALDLGAAIQRGAVSPDHISGQAWQLGTLALTALADAQRVQEWEAEQRRKAIERARGGK